MTKPDGKRRKQILLLFIANSSLLFCRHTLHSAPITENASVQLPRLVLQTGHAHGQSINTLTLSPDGRTLVSGTDDQTIKFWDIPTGAVKATVTGDFGRVFTAAYAPDGQTVASGGLSEKIYLWDKLGNLQKTLALPSGDKNPGCFSLAFSPDSSLVAAATYGKKVYVWDAKSGLLKRELNGQGSRYTQVAFSPDGMTLAAGSESKIWLWDVATGQSQRTLSGHTGPLTSLSFSRDGKYLLSGSADSTLRLWDSNSGTSIQPALQNGGSVRLAALSPDGGEIVGIADTGIIKVWNTTTGQLKRTTIPYSSQDAITSLCYSTDGSQLATGTLWGTIALRDPRTWNVTRKIEPTSTPNAAALSASPNGSLLAVGIQGVGTQSGAGGVQLWSTRTGALVRTLTGHSQLVDQVVFSTDSQQLVSQSPTELRMWDLTTGRVRWRKSNISPDSLAFSKDGKLLITGSRDGIVSYWNAQTGKLQRTLRLQHTNTPVSLEQTSSSPLASIFDEDRITSMTSLPDGTIATVEEKADAKRWSASLNLWSGKTGQLHKRLPMDSIALTSPLGRELITMQQRFFMMRFTKDLVCSPDGQTLGLSLLGKLQLWDTHNGKLIRTLNPIGMKDPDFVSFNFSPDGKAVISSRGRIWNVVTGTSKQAFTEINGSETLLTTFSTSKSNAKSPRYNIAMADFTQGTTQILSSQNGQLLISLHPLATTSSKAGVISQWISFTPDNYYLGSAGCNKYIRWRVGEYLSPAERYRKEFMRPDLIEARLQ